MERENIQVIDKNLLASSKKKYEGELAFFAIDEKCRGKGLGNQLFGTVVEYMKSQNISEFYLFTDTSCNYPFYEHMGLKRRCKKTQDIECKWEKRNDDIFSL